MMIGTGCRIGFLQYLPNQPTKFVIKVWVLAEAKSGYVLGFQVYTGATSDQTESKGLAERDFMEPYHGKHHSSHVYTSPSLFLELLCKGTYATGTVRTNRRNFPDKLRVDKQSNQNVLKVGQYRFAQHGELVAVLWYDRREVLCDDRQQHITHL